MGCCFLSFLYTALVLSSELGRACVDHLSDTALAAALADVLAGEMYGLLVSSSCRILHHREPEAEYQRRPDGAAPIFVFLAVFAAAAGALLPLVWLPQACLLFSALIRVLLSIPRLQPAFS